MIPDHRQLFFSWTFFTFIDIFLKKDIWKYTLLVEPSNYFINVLLDYFSYISTNVHFLIEEIMICLFFSSAVYYSLKTNQLGWQTTVCWCCSQCLWDIPNARTRRNRVRNPEWEYTTHPRAYGNGKSCRKNRPRYYSSRVL